MSNLTEYLQTKTTRIGTKWHCRLIDTRNDTVIDEMACELRSDIGYCCYTMLRWHDKCGGLSPMASAARDRQKYNTPLGRVWHTAELDRHKGKVKKSL